MKKLLFLLLFGLVTCTLNAQQAPHDGCASDQMLQRLLANDPRAALRQAAFDQQLADIAMIRGNQRTSGITTVRTIPVVVHIIHNGGPENLSNTVIQQGIQDMNDAFANVGIYDPLTGVNTDIQFCLASQDPSGAGTTGIVRVQSPLTNVIMETQDLSLKALSRWDPTKYLNIWLVAEISSQSMGSGVAGYAYFPSSHGQPEDGIVNEARWFGSNPHNSKIHVHEAGHYLGLYHTFQGGCTNNNCLTDGDRVCDTPPDNSTAATICTNAMNTCATDDDDLSNNNPFRPVVNGGLGDQPDMIMNYMDYGFQSCQSAFTQGQSDRMNAALSGTRASLLSSLGCLSPCPNPINCTFTPNATNVTAGTLVTFTNNTTGATTYDWTRNGVSFSTNANPTWIPNAAGTFVIMLTAGNGDPSCTRTFSVTITVTCSENASFTASATSVPVGGTVNFTNTSTGGSTNFQWLLDGVPMATTTQFSHTFPTVGGYNVSLVQIGTSCSDTSLSQYITVGNCQPKYANRWYFGHRGGIDFSTGQPVAVYDGNPTMNAAEAICSISDAQGNLQFYCDGQNVYNKLHQVMVNGTNMMGGYSCTQGAMAIPKPGSTTIYYLFTQAHFGGSQNDGDGLYVSEIDMTLDNGNGAVTIKTDTLQRIATEKLTAVNHCNGRDVWVINHEYGTDAFNAFLVTPNGIQPAVVSNIGWVHAGGFNNTTSLGAMKASPDGKKLAVAIYHPSYAKLELFDFNNATGVVSNPYTIVSPNLPEPYSVEFSPDGSRLYVDIDGDRQQVPASLWQLDMTAGSYAAIEASLTKVSGNYVSFGGLQLAPDGKIYMGRYETAINEYYLARIENPNALGLACNFNYNGFYIGQNNQHWSSIGLPLFNSSFFTTTTPEVEGPDTVCANSQGIVFRRPANACSGGGTVSYQVSGDAQVISFTDTTATLSFGAPGNVILTIVESAPCGAGSGDWHITVMPSDTTVYLGPDVSLCTGATTTLTALSGFTSYLWNTGATTPSISVNTPGTYWCEVTGGSQCRPRDSVVVSQSNIALNVNLGPDQTVCSGQVATLDAGPGFASYLWQDGSTNQTFTAWFAGNYSVTVTGSQCNGSATDQAQILHSQIAQINLGNDTALCSPSILLNPGTFTGNALWQDGSTGNTFTVTQPGTYWLQVSNNLGCASGDTIEVTSCVATQDPLAGLNVQIWPNPATENLHIRVEAMQRPRSLQLSLWDMTGRELLTIAPTWTGDHLEAVFDVTAIAKGMYFLRMETEKGLRAWKVEID
ncbi:MAG: T9SS type A sorting domain-containing protein [Bacteroidetes bacterium]|nr:T9SS type A sorting domain-containing protein [Bacteroidota bacterium]